MPSSPSPASAGRLAALLAAVLAGLAGALPLAHAEPTGGSVPLTFREMETPQQLLDLTWGGREITPEPPGPSWRAYTPPAGAERPAFFRVQLPWMRGRLAGMVARSGPAAAAWDRLWLDWNGDRRFSEGEESRLVEGSEGETRLFREASDSPSGDPEKRGRFRLLLHEDNHLHVVPAGCWEGEAVLDGRPTRIGVVDRNMDLAVGSAVSDEKSDLLLVDFNRDGAFTGADRAWMARPWELEALPLRRLMPLEEGAWHRVLPARDGSSLSLERDTAPLGVLRAEAPAWGGEVEGKSETLWVRAPRGEARVPAGEYDLLWTSVGQADARGGTWSAVVAPGEEDEDRARLKVPAEGTVSLPGGAPFRLGLEVTGTRARQIRLAVRDRAGLPVVDLFSPPGEPDPAPSLRVTGPDGRDQACGPCRRGEGLTAAAAWTPPRGARGTFRARAEWPLGPFAVEPAETGISVRSRYGSRGRRYSRWRGRR